MSGWRHILSCSGDRLATRLPSPFFLSKRHGPARALADAAHERGDGDILAAALPYVSRAALYPSSSHKLLSDTARGGDVRATACCCRALLRLFLIF